MHKFVILMILLVKSLFAAVLLIASSHAHSESPTAMEVDPEMAAKLNAIAKQSQTIVSEEIKQEAMDTKLVDKDTVSPDHRLYYFLSFSMPESLLRAYLIDATWTGGQVVFYGSIKDMEFTDFLRTKMQPLLNYEGGHPDVMIDPNLFEKYEVTVVPTVVFALDTTEDCELKNPPLASATPSEVEQQDYSCKAADPKKYWKLSGGVTIAYTLEQFLDAGAPVHSVIRWLQRRGDRMGNTSDIGNASDPVKNNDSAQNKAKDNTQRPFINSLSEAYLPPINAQ